MTPGSRFAATLSDAGRRPGPPGPSGESLSVPQAAALRRAALRTAGRPRPDRTTPTGIATAADVARVDAGMPDPRAGTVRSPLVPGLPLSTDPDWHLARRIAAGPTPDIVAEIKAVGRAAWLTQQLAPATIADTHCDDLLRAVPAATMTAAQAVFEYYSYDLGWKVAPAVIHANLMRRIFSRRYLLEAMVEFWHDLLHVTAESDKGAYWIGDYDTFVIRKYALGSFATLLRAATTHPAMLDYLDNSQSTKQAPNENLGRELLELHTLGVGRFTEADVKSATLLLTGFYADWGTMRSGFDPANHHVGPITIVGRSYPNGSASGGPAALTAMLNMLARHPDTARRICTRLAVRFVSDTPPAALVNRLIQVYLTKNTAIAPVLRALFTSAEFAASIGRKWRRPIESQVAMVRAGRPVAKALDAAAIKDNPWALLPTDAWLLDIAGHRPLNWPAPDGYPDSAPRWMHTNGMLSAWNNAEAAVWNWAADYTMQPWTVALGVTEAMTPRAAVDRTLAALTGFTGDPATTDPLVRFLWSGSATGALPPVGAKVGKDRLDWYFATLVRMAMATPYIQIR